MKTIRHLIKVQSRIWTKQRSKKKGQKLGGGDDERICKLEFKLIEAQTKQLTQTLEEAVNAKENKKLAEAAEKQKKAKEKEERKINRELKKQKNLAKKQKAAAKLKEENDVFAAVEVGMANGIASVSQQVPGSGMARFFGK